ncbi:FtsK/SpoIIIE domain-containing protein [Amycolatopsis cihanbeyliensis]|nr:FtsK/SpoIIIE domain-containing protein [Amycolatopsis cihanbeyliensis]
MTTPTPDADDRSVNDLTPASATTPANTPADTTNPTGVNTGMNGDVTTPANTTETTHGAAAGSNVVPLRPHTEIVPDAAIDGEIVDDPAEPRRPVPVDLPEDKPSWWEQISEATARPLVASWLRSGAEIRSRVVFLLRYAAHVTTFHGLRLLPVYVPVAVFRSFGAVLRGLRRVRDWVFDAESKPVRMTARDRQEFSQYMTLREARNDAVRKRSLPVLLAVLALAAVVVLAVTYLPPLWNWTLLVATLVVLGWRGAPSDRPVVSRAVNAERAPKLTSDTIITALGALGIGELNKALAKRPDAVGFPNPISRDGDGWRADIDLPPGVTAGDVIAKREELSSGLRRQLGCVWPEGDMSVHEGRLVLWVGDKDMARSKQPVWPLGKPGAVVDLFRPQPFGTDQRGRWVPVTLMFASVVIGAMPRMGKTVTLRELMLMAALDPRAVLYNYDLKGTGDLAPLAPVSHAYGVGDDPEDLERMVVEMRELREELRRRTKVIRSLPESVCPDNKVTPALAARQDLRLGPIVVAVDECQVWFEHAEYGRELEEICTDLVKRGPALGITLIAATQRPDAKSLPTGISANAILRFCLKVQGQTENDMVLGTSQYKSGVRATMFARSDRGIGYLAGEGDDAKIVRSVYKDGPEAKKIVSGARLLREQAGTITGHAAGESVDIDAERLDPLSDTLAVFQRGENKLWSDTIVTRLAELRPRSYEGWSPANLATALKPHGVKPRQVWDTDPTTGKGSNRNGYTRDALTTAKNNRE